MIDISNWTMGELATLEGLSGQSINSIGDDDTPKVKTLTAMAFLYKRRTGHPDYKYAQAEKLTMAEISELLDLNDDTDEDLDEATEGEDDPKASPGPEPATLPFSSSTVVSPSPSTGT